MNTILLYASDGYAHKQAYTSLYDLSERKLLYSFEKVVFKWEKPKFDLMELYASETQLLQLLTDSRLVASPMGSQIGTPILLSMYLSAWGAHNNWTENTPVWVRLCSLSLQI